MEPELKKKVGAFHLKVTFGAGMLFILGSLAAAYVAFFRDGREFPGFLVSLGRFLYGR